MGTVSSGSMAAMSVTLVIALVLPIVVLLVYAIQNKKQGIAGAWFLGAAGFFVTQILIRTPILTALNGSQGFVAFAQNYYPVYAILLAFTAGLFEVAGRYAVAKIMCKKLTYKKGLAAGLGHGGIEAILLIGISYISNLLYASMINSGTIQTVIAQTEALGTDVAPIYSLVDALVNTPAAMFLLAGYERILTMICQAAMSLLVCYFVWKKQDIKGIGICLLMHTVLDGVAAVVSGMSTPYLGSVISQNVSYVMIYVFLTIMAVLSVCIISKIRKAWLQPQNTEEI